MYSSGDGDECSCNDDEFDNGGDERGDYGIMAVAMSAVAVMSSRVLALHNHRTKPAQAKYITGK